MFPWMIDLMDGAKGVLGGGSQSSVVVEVRPGPDAVGRGSAPDIFVVTYTEPGLGPVKFGHVVVQGRDLRIGPGQPLVCKARHYMA